MSARVAIIGSGDLGQLLAHHLPSAGLSLAGFFDDFRPAGEAAGDGVILGGLDAVAGLHAQGRFDQLLVAVGYRHFGFRRRVFERFRGSIPFARLVHASSYVDPSARLGEGAVLLPGCVLDRGVVLHDNCLLNTGCIVAHDTQVGAHSFLGPGVRLAGFISIGEASFLGIGTTVIDNLTVAGGVQTGGGTVVTRNIESPGLYVGVPARLVRAFPAETKE